MKSCLSSLGRRSAAAGVFALLSTLAVQAQQPAYSTGTQPLLLKSAVTGPISLSMPEGVNYSSSVGAADTTEPVNFALLAKDASADQPPPRRRYGRPNYHDSRTNPDGSSKYAFEIGGGLTIPEGNTYKYLKTSYAVQAGVGRNFNRQLGVMAQFNWDNFVFQGNNLAHQLALYNSLNAGLTSIGGNSHLWSLSINPTFNFSASETGGAYVVVGVGFYHKTANFTTPGVAQYQDPYTGYVYQYQANQTIDKYTSNAPGFSGGIGLTHKISRFANEQFYAEARYVFVDNTQRFETGTTSVNTPPNSTAFNAYPANSNRTSYIPITVGLRF